MELRRSRKNFGSCCLQGREMRSAAEAIVHMSRLHESTLLLQTYRYLYVYRLMQHRWPSHTRFGARLQQESRGPDRGNRDCE